MYHLYILHCADGTLYTGITTDVERRLQEHNTSPRGAKYTRTRRPVVVVYRKAYRTRSLACKAEYRVKCMTREEKIALIMSNARSVCFLI